VIPVAYYAPDELTSPKFAYAFAKGCHGSMTTADVLPEHLRIDGRRLGAAPVAFFGSPSQWPVLRKAQAVGRDWYYGDHAYFGRKTFYRITRNAYQHDGTGDAGPERFAAFGREVQPWRASGGHVLVCPNSNIHFALHGEDGDLWLKQVIATLRTVTDRPVRVRWKRGNRVRIIEDLKDAWAVVVYSSAAALDALIAGVPVFVTAPFAAAYRMGLADVQHIESPIYPDGREPFLWNLAAHQWTLSEIYRGMAWRSLTAEVPLAA